MGSYTQQQQPPYIGRDPVVIVQDTQHSKLVCILHLDYVHRAMEAPSGGCWLEAAAGTEAQLLLLLSKSAMELAGLVLVMCVSVCVRCGALLSSIEPLIFVHISLKQHQSVLS
jgi:hypothetical protein